MAKPVYIAQAILRNGESRTRDFGSQKNAEAWARKVANEQGACRVVRIDREHETVVFNTHVTQQEKLAQNYK